MRLQAWRWRRPLPEGTAPWRGLERAWNLAPEAARLAWLRGSNSPEDLAWRMDPNWERTVDPFLMEGMGLAVARIQRAIKAGEPICVYGDYDVDGVTATALLVRVLERLGATANYFIPNRFSDGYGLHLECIREIAERQGKGLLISVDCGVRSFDEVAASRDLGLEWVITDHHALGDTRPEACAVVHPALGEQPNRHLAGVGVAFKLGQALLDAVPVPRGADATFLDGLLKLVAIGTLADMVPLWGENALLVKRGLRALGGANGPGLAKLLRAARIEGEPGAQQIAFGVVPRLNAVGRMGGAEDAVRLLLTRDAEEASVLAERVELLNLERRAIQQDLLHRLPPHDGAPFDLVVDPDAHKGVIGIVAGQRMRETGVPTAVCTVLDGIAHCSLRAPEGYDLGAMLDLARPFLRSGGGHRSAAGMSFEVPKTAFVRQTFTRGAAQQALELPAQAMDLDGLGTDMVPMAEGLKVLEPFGQGFPEPVVALEGALRGPIQSFGEGHRKLRLQGHGFDLTWFNGGGPVSELEVGSFLRLAVSPLDHPRWGRSWQVKGVLAETGP